MFEAQTECLSENRKKRRRITLTGLENFEAGVGQVDWNVVLEPADGRRWVASRTAEHHRVSVLLDGFQRRTLDDTRISGWNCTRHTK